MTPRVRWTRRAVMFLGVAAFVLAAVVVYSLFEARWVRVRIMSLSDRPCYRIVQITDLHFRGDRRYLGGVFDRVASLRPDLVCITGDLVEHSRDLDPVLDQIRRVKVPVYVAPGNWEYISRASFRKIEAACAQTGGAFLRNRSRRFDDDLSVIGLDNSIQGRPDVGAAFLGVRGGRTLVLLHCPMDALLLGRHSADIILAGHSHGGQVRLPLVGALQLPDKVGEYSMGLFGLPAGPLYVSPGIGTWLFPVRFLCRPEITVVLL